MTVDLPEFDDTEALCKAIFDLCQENQVANRFTEILGSYSLLRWGPFDLPEAEKQACRDSLALIGWLRPKTQKCVMCQFFGRQWNKRICKRCETMREEATSE